MTTLTTTQPAAQREADDMDAFPDAVCATNPFTDNRVNGPSDGGVDVDDIHAAAFGRLTELAGEAVALRRGIGAVLWGEAGVGKSHVLARLMRWAEKEGRAHAVYLHNLQADPDNLPRSLLKAVVSVLTRGRVSGFRSTPLYGLALGLLREALDDGGPTWRPWAEAARAYARLVERIGPSADRPTYDVLYRYLYSSHRAYKTRDEAEARLAVRWLSGDWLDPAEARLLGLTAGAGAGRPVALEDNERIKQVLVALSRAALSRGRPFLLCFDQVDNLDERQAAALSRFLEALLDAAPDLLVVTAGVQASLFRWRQDNVFQDSAWDRVAQFEVALQKLSPRDGRRIVAARLEEFVTPFAGSDAVRRRVHEDDLFPLGRVWADEFFGSKVEVRPRDVMNGAREAWRRQQEAIRQVGGDAWLRDWGGSPVIIPPTVDWTEEQLCDAIDHKVTQKIAELCDEQRQRPETLPPDEGNLVGLVAALLRQCGGLEVERPPSGTPDRQFPYSLVARRQAERRTVRCLVNSSAFSSATALRWLAQNAETPDFLLLVTEERSPLAFGAQPDAKGRQYYEDLRGRGEARFRHIELTFEEYIRLDALHAVIGMAHSGDLEIELPGGAPRRVGEGEVIESHRRQGWCLAIPVLRDLLAGRCGMLE